MGAFVYISCPAHHAPNALGCFRECATCTQPLHLRTHGYATRAHPTSSRGTQGACSQGTPTSSAEAHGADPRAYPIPPAGAHKTYPPSPAWVLSVPMLPGHTSPAGSMDTSHLFNWAHGASSHGTPLLSSWAHRHTQPSSWGLQGIQGNRAY